MDYVNGIFLIIFIIFAVGSFKLSKSQRDNIKWAKEKGLLKKIRGYGPTESILAIIGLSKSAMWASIISAVFLLFNIFYILFIG